MTIFYNQELDRQNKIKRSKKNTLSYEDGVFRLFCFGFVANVPLPPSIDE